MIVSANRNLQDSSSHSGLPTCYSAKSRLVARREELRSACAYSAENGGRNVTVKRAKYYRNSATKPFQRKPHKYILWPSLPAWYIPDTVDTSDSSVFMLHGRYNPQAHAHRGFLLLLAGFGLIAFECPHLRSFRCGPGLACPRAQQVWAGALRE